MERWVGTGYLQLYDNETWWGGAIVDSYAMPYGNTFIGDLGDLRGNQGMPLLISNHGRWIWCDQPFKFCFADRKLSIEAFDPTAVIQLHSGYGLLPETVQHMAQTHFPLSGALPDPLLFSAPQYNTWIEMLYFASQARVLDYAAQILAHDFPPGVLIIDTLWHEDYGNWRFHSGRFPEPQVMVKQLHELGFKVMLWVSFFVSPDSLIFRFLRERGYLLCDVTGKPCIVEWWDGYSAIINIADPAARTWYTNTLDGLVHELGIDGFKFDGGNTRLFAAADTQLSAAPWRLLDAQQLAACRAAAHLHVACAPEILALAEHAACTGEPILRPLAYGFPTGGYEQIRDQFLLGNDLLVAPVLEQRAIKRQIVVPPGQWVGDDDTLLEGPTTVWVDAPLTRLPWYRRVSRAE
jgi:alpha-glucosidase (family GH31 glycosyl hydrolase)